MSCPELVHLVTSYLEEELPDGERHRFERHLTRCDDCGIYVEQMRVTVRTIGRLPPEAISAEARERLLDVFRDWKRQEP